MLRAINSFLESKNSVYITFISLILVTVIGIFDYLTHHEISFSLFYVLPIILSAWYGEKHAGFTLCFAATILGVLADYSSGHKFTDSSVYYWNTIVIASLFVIISYLTSNAKYNYIIEKDSARTDSLTGVMNLRKFMELSEALFKISARSRCSASICYIDVDHLKLINNTYGGDEGDRLLKMIATTLNASSRKSDSVGRLGSDEFAVFLYNCNLTGAKIFTNRILNQLHENMKDIKFMFGFSIGVAVFDIIPSSYQEAIKYADTLMSRAKKSGGNQIIYGVFPQSDDTKGASNG